MAEETENSSDILVRLVEERLQNAQKNKAFKDEGRTAGSAKERRAISDITSANLENIEANEIEARRLIVKAKIWPGVDIEAEKSAGTTSGATFLKVALQKQLAAAPYNSKAARSIYLKTIEAYKEVLGQAKTVDEVIATSRTIFASETLEKIAPEIVENEFTKSGKKTYWKQATREKADIIFGKAFTNLANFKYVDAVAEKIDLARLYESYSAEKAEEYKAKSIEAYKKQLAKTEAELSAVAENPRAEINRYFSLPKSASEEVIKTYAKTLTTSLTVRKERLIASIKNPPIPDRYKEHPEDWNWAYEKKERAKTEKEGPRINSYEYLSHIVRKGGIAVDKIGTKGVKSYWGLSAVQYGNSLTDAESEKLTFYANGSFMDLEQATGLNIKKLNETHGLTLDFATRGVAGSAATYWADYKVINLNRRNGDGSLNHEFGHYIDNLLAKKAGISQEEKINGHKGYFASASGAQVPEIDSIIKSLINYIEQGDGTQTTTRVIKAGSNRDKYNLYKGQYQNWQDCLEYYKTRYPKEFYAVNGGFGKAAYILSLFNVEKAEITLQTGSSQVYYTSLFFADGNKKGYWVKPAELFARCWEVYVLTKLNEANITNNFLQPDKVPQYLEAYGQAPYAQNGEAEKVTQIIERLVEGIKKHYNAASTKTFDGPKVDYNEVNTTLKDNSVKSEAEKADKLPEVTPEPKLKAPESEPVKKIVFYGYVNENPKKGDYIEAKNIKGYKNLYVIVDKIEEADKIVVSDVLGNLLERKFSKKDFNNAKIHRGYNLQEIQEKIYGKEETPKPTPPPAEKPVAEKPAEEPKKQRELSYKQQVTLMIGRVKALGGKMTEAQVIAEGRKLHEARTKSGAALDKSRNSTRRLSPTPENLLRWANNPGEFDLIGVDTINYLADPTADYKREISKQKLFNLYKVKV